MSWVALWQVGSSWTRNWTCIPCISRQILNHWTPREVLGNNPWCWKISTTFIAIVHHISVRAEPTSVCVHLLQNATCGRLSIKTSHMNEWAKVQIMTNFKHLLRTQSTCNRPGQIWDRPVCAQELLLALRDGEESEFHVQGHGVKMGQEPPAAPCKVVS